MMLKLWISTLSFYINSQVFTTLYLNCVLQTFLSYSILPDFSPTTPKINHCWTGIEKGIEFTKVRTLSVMSSKCWILSLFWHLDLHKLLFHFDFSIGKYLYDLEVLSIMHKKCLHHHVCQINLCLTAKESK